MLAVADYSITQTIAVDFQSAGVPPSVLAKQYDHELRTIAVHLWDGGNAYHVPDGYVGRIAVLKPDGHHVLNDCEVHNDASYGTAVAYAVITEQLSAAAGKARAEIQISGTDGSLRTADFFLDIVPAVVGDDVITSTDEYKSIDAILAQVQESAQAAAASAAEAQDIVDEAKLEGAFDVDVQVGTVTTLDAGSNATVTNVSTQPGVAVLDFGIPRGSDAEKGMTTEEASAYAAHAHTGEDGTVKVDAGNISNLADYIVEQGVSGIWTYRKWASGIIECWGQTDIGAVGITNTTGNQYYSDTQYLDYPSLANQVDHVSLSAYSDVTVYTLSEYWLANSKIAYRLMSGYQVTTPDVTRVSVYVMGRWQQNA